MEPDNGLELVAALEEVCSSDRVPMALKAVALQVIQDRQRLIERRRSIDRDRTMASVRRIEAKAPYPQLSDRDLNRLAKLASVVGEFDGLTTEIAFLDVRIAAMVAFGRGGGWEVANRFFEGLPSRARIEAGVVWLWLQADAGVADRVGEQFEDIFVCGDRWVERSTRKKDDDEFWTLLRFLPEYHTKTGRLLLPTLKSETPDFKAIDLLTGAEIGIEVGYSMNAREKQLGDAFEKFVDAVDEQVSRFPLLITYIGVPDLPAAWGRAGRKNRGMFAAARRTDIEFVTRLIQRQAGSRRSVLGKEVILPSGGRFVMDMAYQKKLERVQYVYVPKPHGSAGNQVEAYAAQSLQGLLAGKVTPSARREGKTPSLPKRPETDYTILVAVARDFLAMPDLGKIAASIANQLPETLKDYFQEVWLYRSSRLEKVFPVEQKTSSGRGDAS